MALRQPTLRGARSGPGAAPAWPGARTCRLGRALRVSVRAQAPPFLPDAAPAAPAAAEPETVAKPAQPACAYEKALMLQAFGWDSWKKGEGNWYGKVKEAIPDIKALGATHVWLPPPSHSVSAEGYLPGQLYDLESKYGNEDQLRDLCTALKQAGILPMADIVINHRCADEKQDGVYNKFKDHTDHVGSSIEWGRWAITANDPVFKGKGNPDTGDDFHAAPDLDHTNPDLRAALKDWLNWLAADIGFAGWRFDFVRGYAPNFVGEYIDATLGGDTLHVGELWTDVAWNGENLEYDQNASRQRLCDWINGAEKRACAFDFTTKAVLQEATKRCQYDRLRDGEGKAPGLLGWWPGKAVTFLENHDTGSTQQHWPFPSEFVGTGYAYLLTHPGIPCVFWDHVTTWGPELKDAVLALAALRRRAGVDAESKLEILAADPDLYVARVADRVLVKLGPRMELGELQPGDDWSFVLSGKDWAVWEKTA
ncbi:hypothetical protein HYH03_012361 [Edaphochlamys debaryana]|uniref:alpha-amylase n=1 Tax=Edaphochlamys debaryana TaxID=47281 RepID=A0A835XT00_9CHLO|nr:hypothetical protein HYH03_012361 [Edaphochlamys debaryana]|eukprot:KAG2489135.1 hypothetical protein HYH03_012361 [Edaphochlamys debaryana]